VLYYIKEGDIMGFIKRLLGLEIKPGEPKPVNDGSFDDEVLGSPLVSIVDFYSLWCPPCQVMSGLLNEVGVDYVGRVNLFKLNVQRDPSVAARHGIHGVPTLIAFRDGAEIDRLVGLFPIDVLREWIEKHLD
jgi:thioredoxin